MALRLISIIFLLFLQGCMSACVDTPKYNVCVMTIFKDYRAIDFNFGTMSVKVRESEAKDPSAALDVLRKGLTSGGI